MSRLIRPLAWLLLSLLPLLNAHALDMPSGEPVGDHELWLLVDDASSTLHVYRGEHEIERFSPVSLGRGGAKRLRREGDRSTPLGTFRINRVKLDSDFRTFLGLDFPTPEHAREAWDAGMMTATEYADFMSHLRRYGEPPQDTVMGGYIGIHGLGSSDPDFHRRFDWTQGCVAVTNDQIDWLLARVEIGTRVVIR